MNQIPVQEYNLPPAEPVKVKHHPIPYEGRLRAAALREKLTSAEHDHLGTRRLLRAFPDMKSLNYADTLAATRAATQRLRELAAAAKAAAKETAANAAKKIKKA